MAGREQNQGAEVATAEPPPGAATDAPAAGDARAERSHSTSFVAELRRRHVPRAAAAYVLACFGLLQGVDVVSNAFDLPRTVLTVTAIIAVLGFPVNLVVAWFVDIAPEGSGPAAPHPRGSRWTPERRIVLRKPTWAAVGALALLAAGLAVWRIAARDGVVRGPPKAQTVLVADFDNRTGDAVFDGTLEPALAIAMEGASFITSYNRLAAQRTADQLKLDGAGLSESRARLVAQREGISVVTAGTIERTGVGYRLTIRALDAVTGAAIVQQAEDVPSKETVLAAATKLAAGVRAALGDATPESVQLTAGETFSAASLEAAHAYAQGMGAQFAGDWAGAVKHYHDALKLDPNLGRAYAGLAVIENNRGHSAEAQKYFKQAMAHVGRMSEREKYRSRGAYYLVVDRDPDKAIEALSALVEKFPADNAGLANLAVAYQLKRDFPKALDNGRRAIAIYPKNVPQRNNVGLFAMYAGEYDAAVKEQTKVLELNPAFVEGHVGLALAHLAAGRRDEAVNAWNRLAASGAAGASVAAEGLADLAVSEGRLADARRTLEPAIAVDVGAKDTDGAARKLVLLADVLATQGDLPAAATAAARALELSRGDSIAYQAGAALARAGDARRATDVAEELDKRLSPEARMYAELVRGEVELRRDRPAEAVAHFRAAHQRVDAWLARFHLARAYLAAGAPTQAHDELEACERRRGEGTDVFLEAQPTYRLAAAVPYWLGRAHEALGSPEAGGAYRAFIAARRGDDDPLAADARQRLAAVK